MQNLNDIKSTSTRVGFFRGLVILLLLLSFTPWVGLAQEGGWTESFEGGELQGWELGPDVATTDGSLVISPGNFAARLGDFLDYRLTFKVRVDSEGAFRLVFYARDESEYALMVFPDEMFLERRQGRQPVQMAIKNEYSLATDQWNTVELSVVGGSLQVQIDDQQLLTANDPNPLQPGALVFINIGPGEISIDDVVFVPQAVEGREPGPGEAEPAGEERPPEGEGPPMNEEPGEAALIPPAATPTAEPTGVDAFLQSFATAQTDRLQLTTIAINLALSALFAFVLGQAYVHWGMSLSNRRALAANFMLISVTTTFIILVVRSSVALSLGLVGALSIVRFRAAIKEPEELAFLFFSIGLGIGLGDNQRMLTLLALLVGLILIGLGRLFRRRRADVNLHLIVSSHDQSKLDLDTIIETLQSFASRLKLQRFDENGERMEASFMIEFADLDMLQAARDKLRSITPEVEITFLDNRGVV
jgi:hypothetical protein